MGRYFVAVRPPESALVLIDEMPRPESPSVRWAPRDQLHITLAFLGDIDENAMTSVLGSVGHLPVAVDLGPSVEMIRNDVIVVPAGGLDDLADVVQSVVRPIAPDLPDRRFQGHLTVGRCRAGPPSGVVGHPVSVGFVAGEVELVRSELTSKGATHETVARFGLR